MKVVGVWVHDTGSRPQRQHRGTRTSCCQNSCGQYLFAATIYSSTGSDAKNRKPNIATRSRSTLWTLWTSVGSDTSPRSWNSDARDPTSAPSPHCRKRSNGHCHKISQLDPNQRTHPGPLRPCQLWNFGPVSTSQVVTSLQHQFAHGSV